MLWPQWCEYMGDNRPIGVFDSGVGGLSFLRELDSLMPYENFVYIGDTLRIPYGVKTEEEIIEHSDDMIRFLEETGCKLIVIACNTISSLRPEVENGTHREVPIVGIINYGCVAAAVYVTYNFRIGVWATERTINSQSYPRFIENFDPTIEILMEPCTDLIPLIEEGKVGSPTVRRLAESYLKPMLDKDIDTLIFGCTHLPFLKAVVQDIVGPAVTLIDPARRTAALCRKVLKDHNLEKDDHSHPGTRRFFVTGDPERFRRTARLLIASDVDVEKANL